MTTKTLFVSATGTGVGKSYSTAMLLSCAKKKGIKAVPFKPIETGVNPVAEDATMLLALYKNLYGDDSLGVLDITPYTFTLPAAPYVASGKAKISLEAIDEAFFKLQKISDVVVIEGAGGLLVPLNLDFFMVDLAKRYDASVFFVSRCGLGCINDVLLSKKCLDGANLSYEIFFNERDDDLFDTLSRPFLSEYLGDVRMVVENEIDAFWDRFLAK